MDGEAEGEESLTMVNKNKKKAKSKRALKRSKQTDADEASQHVDSCPTLECGHAVAA